MPPSPEPVIESVADAVHHHIWVEHRTRSIILAILTGLFLLIGGALVLLLVGRAFVGYGLTTNDLKNFEGLLVPILFIPIAIQIPNLLVAGQIKQKFFRQVAASYGLSYADTAPYETVSGHLFWFGHSRGLLQVFAGTHSGHDVRFYTYTFTTGGGKSKTTHYMRVFETECHVELPEIMVHPKSVTPGGMTWQPKETRALRLEGQFNEQFDVFVPEGMEIEALQVLEPHHMDMLMQQYGDMGFYCHGTKLYVFTDEDFPTTRTGFAKLIALVDELYDALVPELHAVSSDVTALREAFAK